MTTKQLNYHNLKHEELEDRLTLYQFDNDTSSTLISPFDFAEITVENKKFSADEIELTNQHTSA